MEHAPIYRSTTRLKPASPFPWWRTASLASAAVGVALGGIALGYHGFAYATDSLQAAAPGGSLPLPAFSVLTTTGGHPDAISVLSTALLTQIQASPVLIQAVGSLPSPFPPQPDPTAVVDAPVSSLDLPLLGPSQLTFADVPALNADAPLGDPALVVDGSQTDPLDAAQGDSLDTAQSDVSAPIVAQLVAPARVADVGEVQAAAEVPAADDQTAADAPVDDQDSAPQAALDVPDPTQAPTAAPPQASQPAAAKPAPTRAPTPKPTPDPAPVTPEPRIAPADDSPPPRRIEREPVVVRRPDPPAEDHTPPPSPPSPPKAEQSHNNDTGGNKAPSKKSGNNGGDKHSN